MCLYVKRGGAVAIVWPHVAGVLVLWYTLRAHSVWFAVARNTATLNLPTISVPAPSLHPPHTHFADAPPASAGAGAGAGSTADTGAAATATARRAKARPVFMPDLRAPRIPIPNAEENTVVGMVCARGQFWVLEQLLVNGCVRIILCVRMCAYVCVCARLRAPCV